MAYKPTDEQQAIIAAFNDGKDIRVQAGAGAGKSSTMIMLAKEKIEDEGLFIAYNRAIKEDMAARAPFNVEVATSHSLAFRAVGVKYKHRLNGPRLTSRQTSEILGLTRTVQIGEHPPMGPYVISRMVSDAVRAFTYSAHGRFTFSHVQPVPGYSEAEMQELTAIILPAARKAWADIASLDGKLRFEHDHYFKLWAMTQPKLPGEFLLTDECQDANPALVQIIQDQDHMQRCSVGDSSQAIYGWRGATDALKYLPGQEMTLSQSFRFGDEIAYEANAWLDVLDAPIRLKGFDQIDSRVSAYLPEAGTVLCRTNGGVMSEAMEAMDEGHKVAVVGGGKQIADLAKACLELQEGNATIHPELLAFKTWEEVIEYSGDSGGEDLKPMVDLIQRYTAKGVLYATNRFVEEAQADRVISTAHKAKGREWDAVRIGSDFYKEEDPETGVIEVTRESAMLCYVAVTRAQKELSSDALDWLKYGNVVIV